MTGLLYLTFLVVVQCGRDVEGFLSQPEKTVRVRPGLSTSLECHIQLTVELNLFWIKFPTDSSPLCIATARTFSDDVKMSEQFENQSRIGATIKKNIFYLLFSSVEQTDIATYVCGTHKYNGFFFGNGSKLVFEENTGGEYDTAWILTFSTRKMQVSEYLVPALAATNVASVFIIVFLCHLLKKKRSGRNNCVKMLNTDELNYAALSFGSKQRRSVPRSSNVETTVIYQAVRHQEKI
ncbi:hypothetical protein AMEX_G10921 [Astyanax mexicanus]|uniref:Immunoglobulin V-set domain-containing protein n=1 Tax=Astyanax mexicanus TaxID=7994 RepID=A0A8T2LTI4_ASTMX|nr:hypothetical protein AMEX_G10921 [Astyanax mexicanus]